MDSLPVFEEQSGTLGVLEFGNLPFTPQRFFWLFQVANNVIRADHAHRTCHQYLVCQRGSLTARVTNRFSQEQTYYLNSGNGLHLPPLSWLELFDFSLDSVLGVFASEAYEQSEYILSKEEFFKLCDLNLKSRD